MKPVVHFLFIFALAISAIFNNLTLLIVIIVIFGFIYLSVLRSDIEDRQKMIGGPNTNNFF